MDLFVYLLFLAFVVGGGITTLKKGRILATKSKVVDGVPARIVGLLLLSAVPLSIAAWYFCGPILNAFGTKVRPDSYLPIIVPFVPLIGCPLLAVIVGLSFAKDIPVLPDQGDAQDGKSAPGATFI